MTDTKKPKRRLRPGRRPSHSGYVFLRSGLIPRENRHVEQYLSAIRAGYIEELGPGEDNLSIGEMILLNQLITCIGFTRLVEERARKVQNLTPLETKHFIHFLKHGRQLVLDLGLNPEKHEEGEAWNYIEQFDKKKKEGNKRI